MKSKMTQKLWSERALYVMLLPTIVYFILFHAFGVTATIVKENGKWVYAKATQAEKNKLAFYALLYKEGLLDNEYVTKQWDTMGYYR